MNRIIIVGNGFDLAHGLKTKYEDFINWYWKQCGYNLLHCSEKEMSDGLCSFKVKDRENAFSWAMAFQGWRYQRDNPFVKWNEIDALNAAVNDRDYCDFSIMSPLFQRICKQMSLGWVDIENEYYSMLVECKGKKDELEKLNKDFAVIQRLLIEYLLSVQLADIDKSYFKLISAYFFAPFQAKDISVKANDKWNDFLKKRFGDSDLIDNIKLYKPFDAKERVKKVHEFKNAYKDQIESMGVESIDGDVLPHDMLYPDRIMLLNFNYTNTADFYFPNHPSFILNNIHGKLTKPESVIFGYGDESDDEYKKLQKINDNEYLRHIKTNRYLETPNYRDLLSFIESGPFQVVIMGHSCGLSDRTMLNTLFEHANCVSIKPYYYVNEQGKDNYLDIVQNISRNFTNPKLMRDRVVNKTFCEELPQVTRKQKEEE
ncbi:MAG: hypothetical protein IKJ23_00175 [Bacteroidaceae bacterium]|nr:hypothetical protein [Bacteroidaceae bacterium]